MAKKQGAILRLNPLEDDVEAKIKEFTNGRGVDVAIVLLTPGHYRSSIVYRKKTWRSRNCCDDYEANTSGYV